MPFTYSGGPIATQQGGHAYDPWPQYSYWGATANDSQFSSNPISQANFRRDVAQYSPFNQAAAANKQAMSLFNALLGQGGGGSGLGGLLGGLLGGGKTGAGIGGLGKVGDTSSYLSQFDLPRQRAQQGLQDQFTQAGGVENLQGPFTTASQQLEQGLGQTEQGAQVDLFSRLLGPQSQILQVLLSSILGGLFGGR